MMVLSRDLFLEEWNCVCSEEISEELLHFSYGLARMVTHTQPRPHTH